MVRMTLERRGYDPNGFVFPTDWIQGAGKDPSSELEFPVALGPGAQCNHITRSGSKSAVPLVLWRRLCHVPLSRNLTGVVRWNL